MDEREKKKIKIERKKDNGLNYDLKISYENADVILRKKKN
jgi:hypothetical protein